MKQIARNRELPVTSHRTRRGRPISPDRVAMNIAVKIVHLVACMENMDVNASAFTQGSDRLSGR